MPDDAVTLVIGAAGAIGKYLVKALVQRNGPRSVVCALHRTALPDELSSVVISEFGVDIRNKESLIRVLSKYSSRINCVWNLAAPLSVETAKDPGLAHAITVGGMESLLVAMQEAQVATKRVCFTDSIGSYGGAAPRKNVPARWLVDHPEQDPGSEYGRQKRECRALLRHYSMQHGFDTRWCVVPGVLHAEESWGAGTTEYALDALLCAATGRPFECPIPTSTALPMIFIEDLVKGLIALMEANANTLHEPERGYSLSGFSFSADELFAEIQSKYVSDFKWTANEDTIEPNAALFASLWPDEISAEEARRDLDFVATRGIEDTVKIILKAHATRMAKAKARL